MSSKEIVKALRRGLFSNELLKISADTIENLESEINRLQADCENYKQIAEHQQSVTMDRGFEIKRLKEKVESLQAENERLKNSRDRWKRLAEDFDRFSREEERDNE